jgi:hypothetical protein
VKECRNQHNNIVLDEVKILISQMFKQKAKRNSQLFLMFLLAFVVGWPSPGSASTQTDPHGLQPADN